MDYKCSTTTWLQSLHSAARLTSKSLLASAFNTPAWAIGRVIGQQHLTLVLLHIEACPSTLPQVPLGTSALSLTLAPLRNNAGACRMSWQPPQPHVTATISHAVERFSCSCQRPTRIPDNLLLDIGPFLELKRPLNQQDNTFEICSGNLSELVDVTRRNVVSTLLVGIHFDICSRPPSPGY